MLFRKCCVFMANTATLYLLCTHHCQTLLKISGYLLASVLGDERSLPKLIKRATLVSQERISSVNETFQLLFVHPSSPANGICSVSVPVYPVVLVHNSRKLKFEISI